MKRTLTFLTALFVALAPMLLSPIAQATVATTSNKTVVSGDGLTTTFSFNFSVRSAADLSVTYTDAAGNQTTLSSSLYTVALSPVPAGQLWATGGTVTYPKSGSAIASGTTLTIYRSVSITQTTSLINQGGYYPSSVEQALDLGVMQAQQFNEIVQRAITAPASDVGITMALPAAAERANSALCFDSSGNAALCSKNTGAVTSTPAPVVVQNVAALKNLSGMVDGVVVVTRGYYTQGDGGAANYFWNSADTSTDNGGSVIALSGGGTGRWNVLFTGNTATFEQFGAKGDGATNDQATLQAAMTWAGTSPYRSLRGTTGRTYKINSGLTVAPNVAIDWNNSTVNASAVASAYVFTMTGVSVEYVVDAPWRNGFVQMSSNATPTIIKISRTVGKLFEGMHFEGVASKCIEYGDNTWLIEWKNGFCKSNSSTSAGAVGTGVYIPAGLFNSGENMKFTGYTFSGLAVAFEIGNEQFDIYCIACAVDYSQKVMHATASSNLSFIGGHLESDYNGAWFQWTAGATGYGQLSLSNLRWLLAASVTNNIIDDGSSTISVKLHGVQMGFSNYTPRDLFKNGSAPISYSQIDVANPEFAPRIGFYLSDPNFTAAGARDWTVGVYDNGGVPAGTVTWTAAAGPSGQYAARLDPDNAGGYVGLYRTISTLSGSPGAYTRLKVQIQYKLQGGKTDANNALELLTVTKDQSGTLQGYSKTAITNATSSWQTYNYVINIAPNADVKFYIEAHDNGGGVNPVFDVSMIWLEIL